MAAAWPGRAGRLLVGWAELPAGARLPLTVLSRLRVRRTLHQNVPSPVPFFQPLYRVHHGNFQVRGRRGAGGG